MNRRRVGLDVRDRRNSDYRLTTEDFKKWLKENFPHLTLLEEWHGYTYKHLLRCELCKTEFRMNKKNLQCYFSRGVKACPTCTQREFKERNSLSREEYERRLSEINPNLRMIGEYVNTSTPTRFMCVSCGNVWEAEPRGYIHSKSNCGFCSRHSSMSKGEVLVASVLKDLDIEYVGQKSFDNLVSKNKLKIDFYIPKFNIAIEYDGEQHYKPIDWFGGEERFIESIKRDKIKNEYCAKYGIPLLRIPYFYDTYEEVKDQIVTFLRQNGVFVNEDE